MKKQMTSEQMYKRNKKLSKLYNTLAPVTYYLLLAGCAIFAYLALKNSIGNMSEIFALLDTNIHSGEEVQANYQYLIEKWGEWEIIGENQAGLAVRYIDIRNALFSGVATLYTILCCSSLVLSIFLGKLLFPGIAKNHQGANEEMVDMATLKSASQIDTIINKKSKKEDWF